MSPSNAPRVACEGEGAGEDRWAAGHPTAAPCDGRPEALIKKSRPIFLLIATYWPAAHERKGEEMAVSGSSDQAPTVSGPGKSLSKALDRRSIPVGGLPLKPLNGSQREGQPLEQFPVTMNRL